MKEKRILPLFVSILLMSSACYKDKGNYDYDENILDISVTLEQQYVYKKEKTDFYCTITPTIDTYGQAKELKYEWFISKNDQEKGTAIGTDKSVTIHFNPNSEDPNDQLGSEYTVRLYVTDMTTKAQTLRFTTLRLIDPYTASWAVLHETDGHAEIGTVEYHAGKYIIQHDTYTQENGTSLKGKPLHLGVRQISTEPFMDYWLFSFPSQLYLSTTELSEGGLIAPGEKFKNFKPWQKLINVEEINNFDPAKIVGSGAGDTGYAMASNGNIFHNNYYSPVMYQAVPDPASVSGPVYITKFGVCTNAGVGYDEKGLRFLAVDMTKNFWDEQEAQNPPSVRLTMMPIREHEGNAKSPNKIPKGYRAVSIFPGYQYGKSGMATFQQYQLYAYLISPDSSLVYTIRGRELSSAIEAPISGAYRFPKPQSINENTRMTSGHNYANIIFYVDGNKVYKHNIVNGQNTVIYEHEDPNAQGVDIRMAVEAYIDRPEIMKQIIETDPDRLLGIAFNIQDKGELVVLHLDNTGSVEESKWAYDNVQVHKGFGPIKSVVFI
ncbi:Uncharacterised protein [Porphyromonas cangingivalis]|uniref:PKD-like family lipoprotein n=1 Tax=Porphyromonas cangingivalis TaxID=36874 RepID=UPI000D91665D|nr:PKD-like family lipoprotein [Porphyromonas cangingivalis]SPY35488.1 Uncharacterised protein [Porphyromonas cangingivalis]